MIQRSRGQNSTRGLLPAWLPRARTRHLIQVVIDALATVTSLLVALNLRFEFDVPPDELANALPVLLFAMGVQFVSGVAFGLYVGRWRFGGFEEVAALARSVTVTALIVAISNRYLFGHPVPVSVTIAFAPAALVLMAGVRWTWRVVLERSLRPTGDDVVRVIVVGAGEAGAQVVTTMLRNPSSPYLPVALLDDDPVKRNLRLMGLSVVGGRVDLADAADRFGATAVVIAIPSADAGALRDLADRAAQAHLDVMVLPSVTELFGGPIGLSDIRPLSEADLLGRRVIDTDLDSIAGYLTGRRVLVTGAGGSIGSELCRQIYRYAPSHLVMLERDESALHAVQLSIEGRAMLDSRDLVVCDIRDAERVRAVFDEHQPEVVFHAAALKHLPLLEMHPTEAVKTNCIGTENLLLAAADHGVDRFVNISTDKAADPSSVLGLSKRVAERLTASASERAPGTFLSVRFGNVLGSRGSVLTAFRAQIEAGGPVTVTHRDVTRFFMTIEEAAQLVIQAGAVGRDGEALVLDMGEPVRIDDVARRLIERADRRIDIAYTGLRPGEKMHEVLFGAGEIDDRPIHHLIAHVPVPPLSAEAVWSMNLSAPDAEVVEELRRLCGHDSVDSAIVLED